MFVQVFSQGDTSTTTSTTSKGEADGRRAVFRGAMSGELRDTSERANEQRTTGGVQWTTNDEQRATSRETAIPSGVPNKPMVLTASTSTEERSPRSVRQHIGRPLGPGAPGGELRKA